MSTKHIKERLEDFNDSRQFIVYRQTKHPKILAATFNDAESLIYFFTQHFDAMKKAKFRTKVIGNTLLVWEV